MRKVVISSERRQRILNSSLVIDRYIYRIYTCLLVCVDRGENCLRDVEIWEDIFRAGGLGGIG